MAKPASILILGGTGHLGRDLLAALARGDVALRAARRPTSPARSDGRVEWVEADLVSGAGVAESVRGMEAIVFCAGTPKNSAALEVEGLKRLLTAARDAGVAHFIFVSIVGIERLPVPYYRVKLAAEEVIRQSGVPFSILRATQFHYFVAMLLSSLNRVPFVLPVPKGFRVQPVATEDVAERLVRALADGPRGLLRDFCGPEIFSLSEVARPWMQARSVSKPIVELPVPGKLGAAFREGHNTNAHGELGTRTWPDWLAREYRGTP
jgi:uncharacterized protein YbjT (DUF2867 family)